MVHISLVGGAFDVDGVNKGLIARLMGGMSFDVGAAATAVGNELMLSDGRTLFEAAAAAQGGSAVTSSDMERVLKASGSYKGGSRISDTASFVELARYLLPQGRDVIRGYAASFAAEFPLLSEAPVEHRRLLGEQFGAMAAAEALGRNTGSVDLFGLRALESVFTLAAEYPGATDFFDAARRVLTDASGRLGAKADAVDADIGWTVKTGLASANGIAGAADIGWQIWNGDLSATDLLADGGIALGAYALTGGRIRPAAADNVPIRTNFDVYEILSQQPINGASRSAHRVSANRSLYRDLQTNPELVQMLNRELGSDVLAHMRSGKGLLNPPGAIWHHPVENPGVVRLLRTSEHNNPLLQSVLHPGPNRTGGFGTHFGRN